MATITTQTADLIHRLTEPHTNYADGHATEWPALIDWISDAVTEQVKRGKPGSGGTGLPINEGALVILQRIERGVALHRQRLFLAAKTRDGLKQDVRDLWTTVEKYRENGELDDADWERIEDDTAKWVSDIEAEWDERTHRMEVTVPCPACDTRWILDADNPDTRRSAVTVTYSSGRAPVAECATAGCETLWVGWQQVAALGFTLGAQQDLAVLEACGIRLENMLN